jgi:hypothetical protein
MDMVTNKGRSAVNLPNKLVRIGKVKVIPEDVCSFVSLNSEMIKNTIFFEKYGAGATEKSVSGAYLLEVDSEYAPHITPCYHIKVSWIFATSL